MGPNITVQQFVKRLNKLNCYLLFFPEECPTPLTQDEIIEILDQAKPPNWHKAMVSANIDIFEMDYESAISYRQFRITYSAMSVKKWFQNEAFIISKFSILVKMLTCLYFFNCFSLNINRL
jgi:hypothetical protein